MLFWSRDPALDASFRLLAGFIVCALLLILRKGLLFRLSEKLLHEWDHTLHLRPTCNALPGLLEDLPVRTSQCLQLKIVCLAEIPALALDDYGAVASGEVLYPSVFRLTKTIYFSARLRMDYQPFGNTRRRVDAETLEAIEAKVARTVKNEDVLIPSFKSAPPSHPPYYTPLDNHLDALKT